MLVKLTDDEIDKIEECAYLINVLRKLDLINSDDVLNQQVLLVAKTKIMCDKFDAMNKILEEHIRNMI